jgi:hypothetical protein
MINARFASRAVHSAARAAKMRHWLTKHVGDFVRLVAGGILLTAEPSRFAASIKAFPRFR